MRDRAKKRVARWNGIIFVSGCGDPSSLGITDPDAADSPIQIKISSFFRLEMRKRCYKNDETTKNILISECDAYRVEIASLL